MSDINYITDTNGKRTHLLLPLTHKKNITLEYIEDVQDIIAFELLKDDKSLDYRSNIDVIINAKKKEHV